MIQANELRLGNIVTINNTEHHPKQLGVLHKVIGVQFRSDVTSMKYIFPLADSSISTKNENSKETFSQLNVFIEPIPLDEYILNKCGFDKAAKTFEFNNWYINHCGFVISNAPDCTESPDDWYLKQDIDKPQYICFFKYLHQLQNLYFALTGKELEIPL